MKMVFTKRDAKYDDLAIVRDGVAAETIPCPKQGIIPHDMVHYAVESVLARRGFLGMVKDGHAAVFETQGGEGEETIERLVEAFQAELWGGRVPTAELLDAYRLGCEARHHPMLPVAEADVDAIRARLDQLTAAWAEVPVNGSLTLDFKTAD